MKGGKQFGGFHPSIHMVDPNGAGITNSVPRAELAGILCLKELHLLRRKSTGLWSDRGRK